MPDYEGGASNEAGGEQTETAPRLASTEAALHNDEQSNSDHLDFIAHEEIGRGKKGSGRKPLSTRTIQHWPCFGVHERPSAP